MDFSHAVVLRAALYIIRAVDYITAQESLFIPRYIYVLLQ